VSLASNRTLAAAFIVAALLAGSCSKIERAFEQAHHSKTPKAESKRQQAPAFTLKDADGKTVSLKDYEGKVVLLNFWATWCGPCKLEIPWFVEFEQKYKDKGFSVVGVSMDEEGWNVIKPFLAEEKVNYRVLLGNDTVGTLYGGVDSLPTTFVIDREGRIAATHIGLVSKSDYQDEIVPLLENKQPAVTTESRAANGSN
jgi:peroxiredoxin